MYSYRKRIFSWKISLSIPTECSRIETIFCFWRWDKLAQIFPCVNRFEWLRKLPDLLCKIPGWHWSWAMGILLGILSWNFWTHRGRGCNRRSLRCQSACSRLCWWSGGVCRERRQRSVSQPFLMRPDETVHSHSWSISWAAARHITDCSTNKASQDTLKIEEFWVFHSGLFFSSFTRKNKVTSYDAVSCYCRFGAGICARVWKKVCFTATDLFKPTVSPAKLLQTSEPPQLSSSTTVSVRRLRVALCKIHAWNWRSKITKVYLGWNSAGVSSHENKQILQNRFLEHLCCAK